ncbi:xanthine dehydrogenase family protein molybdopterin-binding subunit [Beijerinckia sp. L45]|uniref:xanthine dehydrogenase family protein molybdopterin-binding subunit n=1 Tax=Beijerinckia sp. L45 TaxID=1641855 RepID=UPI00131D16C6|nr:xanthine dehydrogenase family protein molybdopterin-binding subunit [Beijerinckia sp. L45]
MSELPGISAIDRPNSYIGRSVPRPNARRLTEGKGRFTDDLPVTSRTVHVAFLRSPHAHAKIVSIDIEEARAAKGVVLVATGRDIAAVCRPWTGVLTHFPGLKSAPQPALAIDRVVWLGEPVVAVAATTRALAEDAIDLIAVAYDELPSVTDIDAALTPGSTLIHPDLGDNIAFQLKLESGEVDAAFRDAHKIVEDTFFFNRHTAVTLEPRSILADYDASENRLTIHQSTQTPYQMQDIYARHLGLPEANVRVVARDVGGSFGMKLHVYGDEMAAAAMAVMLRRPVKFVADRLESFVSDIHTRSHRVRARMAVNGEGVITAMEVDDVTGVGPFSAYPRTSAVEGNQAVRLMGGPYANRNYRGSLKVVFQNKAMMSQYRAVGHPIACAVTEALVDQAANAIGLDALEIRRRNLLTDDVYPYKSPTGYVFERLSHHQCLAALEEACDYADLRRDQQEARSRGVYRGIGIAAFIEITSPGPAFYGVGGARITAQDGCVMQVDPSGAVRCQVSVTEQGQGTEGIMAQIAASALGVKIDQVRVLTGDTEAAPYGGATWASRGASIGGETVLITGRALREQLLALAAAILQEQAGALDIVDGAVVDVDGGRERITVAELARIAYYRPDTLPPGVQAQMTASRNHVPRGQAFSFTNGIQASHVEVDVETGFVRLLGHWVVEDCGRIINPMLVDEQIRGGVVQGIGAALFEECIYSPEGQLLNGTMADYLVPMAAEMPDIHVGHVSTPTLHTELGAKGAGEAGTAGSASAILNAVNDAIRPLGARLTEIPLTPERILKALGRI